MKKRYLLLVLLTILFIPIVVFAEDKDVEIKLVEFIEKSDSVVESTPAKVEDSTLKFDLKFLNVGDYAKYKLVVKNNTNLDLLFDETNLMPEDKSVGYELEYLDNKLIKSNSETTIYLKVMYSHQAASTFFRNSIYDASNEASLNLSDNFISIPNTLKNIGIIPLIIIIGTLGAIIYGIKIEYSNKKVTSMQILVIGIALISLPKMVDALKLYEIPISSRIIIEKVKPKPCTFEGNLTTGAQFIEGQYTYRYHQQYTGTSWYYVQEDGWGVTLTDKDSTDPVTSPVCSSINDKPIVSMSYMFANSKTTSINLDGVDTSHVVNMNYMFSGATGLTELDLSSFNTTKVRLIQYMFNNASNIQNLYLRHFDTSNVISYTGVFDGCSNLESLNLDEWDFSGAVVKSLSIKAPKLRSLSAKNWTHLNDITYWSSSSYLTNTNLEYLDVTGWDVSEINSLYWSFSSLKKLKKITGINTWNTSSFTTIYASFENCESLEELYLSNWDTSNITDFGYAFSYLYKIKSLDVSNWDTSSGTRMNYMFSYLKELESLDVNHFDTSNVTEIYGMFYQDEILTELDISNFDFSKVNDISYMFCNDYNLRTIKLPQVDTNIKNINYMFMNCYMISKLDLSNWDLSGVTSSSDFLSKNYGLIEFKIPKNFNYDVNIVKTLYDEDDTGYSKIPKNSTDSITLKAHKETVFKNGTSFNSDIKTVGDDSSDGIKHFKRAYELPVIRFKNGSPCNVASAENSQYPIYMWYEPDDDKTIYFYSEIEKLYLNPYTYSMFSYLRKIETIETKDMDSSRSYTLSYFVKEDNNLKALDISHFDTSKVEDFYGAFKYLYSLETFDVSNFDTSKVWKFSEMFSNSAMTELDLSNFDFSSSQSVSYMLRDLNNLVVLTTPKNMASTSVDLPCEMVDDDGNVYTKLDSNTPTQIKLYSKVVVTLSIDEDAEISTRTLNYVAKDEPVYGNLPIPTKEGKEFDGWYLSTVNGEKVDNDTKIRKANKYTLYGAWKSTNSVLADGTFVNDRMIQSMKKRCKETIPSYISSGTFIKHILRETDKTKVPTDLTDENIVSINGSSKPTYVWFDTDTIYFYSEADKIQIINGTYLFKNLNNLIDVDLSIFDYSETESLSSLFRDDSNLESIDFSNIDLSNVTDMSWMFYGCKKLKTVTFGVQNTKKLKDISYMFYGAEILETFDLNNLNTAYVEIMSGLFSGVKSLTTISFTGIEIDSVTNMSSMFSNCTNLISVDFAGQVGARIQNIGSMFQYCESLKSVNWDTLSGPIEYYDYAFYNCYDLESIDLSGFTITYHNYSSAFYSTSSLIEIKTPREISDGVTFQLPRYMYFQGDSNSINTLDSNSPTEAVMKNIPWS